MSSPDRPTDTEAEPAEPIRRHPGVLIGRAWIRLVDAPEIAPPHLITPDLVVPSVDRAA